MKSHSYDYGFMVLVLWFIYCACNGYSVPLNESEEIAMRSSGPAKWPNAYATIMYVGTPRDYEYYVAARVLLQSLAAKNVKADLVLIASHNTPQSWLNSFVQEGVRVITVQNIPNPYAQRKDFNNRFIYTLNKLLAWKLVDYERVTMMDADNLVLQNIDELFQCGEFCAVFIDPCIFHTGLFVLQPSLNVFNGMLDHIKTMGENRDGADQGFLTAYFQHLLDMPMFHPPSNGSKLIGQYRLPLGYQMDASYYYLRLRWNVPCGPNSVVTYPGAALLKPWYWWSWPILPLGLAWHDVRASTIGYKEEVPVLFGEAFFYMLLMITIIGISTYFLGDVFPFLNLLVPKSLWLGNQVYIQVFIEKFLIILCVLVSFVMPMLLIPITSHPLAGWGLYLLGSLSLLTTTIYAFHLPTIPMLTPWLLIIGALLVMVSPYYKNGIIRAFSLIGYIAFASPFLAWSMKRIITARNLQVEKELIQSRPMMSKIC